MDCVGACPPHHRRPSPLAHRPPTSVSGGISGVDSSGTNSARRACSAGPAALSANPADSPRSPYAEPQQQPPTTAATSAPLTTAAHASLFSQADCHQERHHLQGRTDASAEITTPSQQQQQQVQYTKHLSLSTLSGSASNLTILIRSNTTASVTTAATDSSEYSTPLSGISSYKQQSQRARTQRVVETNYLYLNPGSSLRPSLGSRSSSHARENEDDEVTAEDDVASAACVDGAAVAGNDDDHHHHQHHQHRRHGDPLLQQHGIRCSASSSKRPRPLPQSRLSPRPQPRQQQADVADEESHSLHSRSAGMRIPDLSAFREAPSTRPATATATAESGSNSREGISPRRNSNDSNSHPVSHPYPGWGSSRSTSGNGTHARVFDKVEYEEDQEVRRVLHPPPHLWSHEERGDSKYEPQDATAAMTITPGGDAAVKSMSSACLSAPDATPVVPPPKRFATGEGEAVALDDLRYVCGSSTAGALSRMATASVCANEEDTYRHQEQPLHAFATLQDDECGRTSQQQQQQHQQRGSRSRKARVAGASRNCGVSGGSSSSRSRLASRRHPNDSITAGIPYDPSRFPPPSQPPNLAAPVTAAKEVSPVAAWEHGSEARLISTSQPSCATPPDTQQQQQSLQLAGANDSAALAPARSPIKLIETRYAFLALSFMMRMLCKLHKGEPIPSSDFHSHCIPPMTVTMYVQRLVRYCACSGEALLCSFLLLLKYVFHSGHPVTIYNAHRLLITSIVLGIKLRDDVYYSNVYYGRIGGISGREMNKLELLFLEKLEWETQVHEDEYVALLDLLTELGIDAEPTSAQLEAFAAAHPDEAAAYVLDEEDNEVAEASTKLQQQGADSSAGSPMKGTATTAADLPAAEQQRLKVLRGAYRLHQWHTIVVPWLARLKQSTFDKAKANAVAAAAARKEEGLRWQQYHREDEASALRHLRPSSASSWISPLSVQKRAISSTTTTTAASAATAAAAAAAWASEPSYQTSCFLHDGSNVPYRSSSSAVVIGGGDVHSTATTSNGNSGFENPHHSVTKFLNDANGGCLGTSTATATPAAVSQGSRHASSSQSHTHCGSATLDRPASPSSSVQCPSQQQHTISGVASSSYCCYYGANSGHQHSGNGTDEAHTLSQVRYHTAAATAVAAMDRSPRAASAHFDITNRAAAALMDATAEPRQHTAQTQHQQLPSVGGTTAQLTSPVSFTTPGSGINVNAQPYYYVSSRMRKQQQQQQRQAAAASPASEDRSATRPGNASTIDTTTAMTQATAVSPYDYVASAQPPSSSTLEGGRGARSPGSSFTSPRCVDSMARFSTYAATSTDAVAGHPSQPSGLSSGIETVLSAMKMSGIYGGTSSACVHNFPTRTVDSCRRPDGGSEQATLPHVLRQPPHSDQQAQVHRRFAFSSQHSLGKKRSKPESYKDY
ncbi:putative CYC2-like cyclin [Leishmania braziliensis MHOM/BR/75/M2904]|uniref:CYC2-like cyclin n=1 Tax=Leishmania braziliensis TaxID=5660 RepID=A4H4D4_LEIBR|nr:putative CYC2-like cyclin [Leishmania braziliensis MHOM/BR/75/M2904]CAM36923.2 putative CYC2-like cyclin [Leishmania braziliensis MHOM/BR/75/M2904]